MDVGRNKGACAATAAINTPVKPTYTYPPVLLMLMVQAAGQGRFDAEVSVSTLHPSVASQPRLPA